ncbi:MAG: hypothetical protein IJW34_05545, partial [Clostridia bacterium]|nr:hypothetical protein [Clostridia bacterium]
IYPLKGKLTSFVIKQFFHFEKGTSDSYEIPPAAVLLHPLRSFRKTSTPQAFLVAVQDTSLPHACSAQGDVLMWGWMFT